MAESGLLPINPQVEFQLRRWIETFISIHRSLVPPKIPGISPISPSFAMLFNLCDSQTFQVFLDTLVEKNPPIEGLLADHRAFARPRSASRRPPPSFRMEMICSSLNRLRFMGLGCSTPSLFSHSSRSSFREAGQRFSLYVHPSLGASRAAKNGFDWVDSSY